MFKNKHFIVALLVAPILAVITYFGVDIAVSEKPHAAKEGESYKLISKSNCRYTSGLCDFENGDFKVQFRSESLTDKKITLSLSSKFPLQGVKVALASEASASNDQDPVSMTATNDTLKNWIVSLPAQDISNKSLRVAIQANNTLYFGETKTEFVTYKTLFTDN